MKRFFKVMLILSVFGVCSVLALCALPLAGVYFVSKDKDVKEFTKNLDDKEKTRAAVEAGVDAVMKKPAVQEVVTKVADGLANSSHIDYINYLPEYDIITFSVSPDAMDMNGVSLGIYSESDQNKPLYTVALQPMGDIPQPAVVMMDKSDSFMRDVTGVDRVTSENPTPVFQKFTRVFSASMAGIPAGRYQMKLENAQNVPGNYFTNFTVPERQPVLKIVPITTEPINATVGGTFDYSFSIENTGAVPAKNVSILVYVQNQRFQGSNPAGAVRQEGDKTFITFAEIPAKGRLPVTVQFHAIAADESMFFEVMPENAGLLHPNERKPVMGSRIGKITGQAVTPQNEDPSTTLVIKRSDFCHAKHGADEAAVKDCTKEQAKLDFPCLKKPTAQEQKDCIAGIYGQ
ncbi:MAG: hypothetical protein EB060_03180 [Proteobacteria bacterium]|nr:hypothetical protein [Pseudomonadota bacterium]